VDATRSLPAPSGGAAPSTAPILPPAQARPAPKFENRAVEIDLSTVRRTRHTSMRAYLFGALCLAVASVAGWFALGEYIYG
jgi:hypothetical protein